MINQILFIFNAFYYYCKILDIWINWKYLTKKNLIIIKKLLLSNYNYLPYNSHLFALNIIHFKIKNNLKQIKKFTINWIEIIIKLIYKINKIPNNNNNNKQNNKLRLILTDILSFILIKKYILFGCNQNINRNKCKILKQIIKIFTFYSNININYFKTLIQLLTKIPINIEYIENIYFFEYQNIPILQKQLIIKSYLHFNAKQVIEYIYQQCFNSNININNNLHIKIKV